MSATMVGQRQKIKKKKTLAKTPWRSPQKRNSDQNINDSKCHISNSFFENIISSIQLFYIRPDVSADIFRVSLYFRFTGRKLQVQQKLAKKIIHCTMQFRSKNLTHFTNLDSLDIENICSRNTAKNLSDFKKFPADMFLLGVRENICTAPFLDTQELNFWSTLKANICILLYISVRNFLPKS